MSRPPPAHPARPEAATDHAGARWRIGAHLKNQHSLDKVATLCSTYVLSVVLKEAAELSGSVAAVPPAAACSRSIGARCASRAAKAGWEKPIVDSLNRGVSRIAALDDLTAKRSRREMVPQGLENIHSAPGNGMAPRSRPTRSGMQARAH